jgi:hypothetical protein
MALDITNEEVGEANTVAAAAQAELVGKLDSALIEFYPI